MMAPIKFAAAAGLVGGIWIPYLAAVTCAALILYFVINISMHIAAGDFGTQPVPQCHCDAPDLHRDRCDCVPGLRLGDRQVI